MASPTTFSYLPPDEPIKMVLKFESPNVIMSLEFEPEVPARQARRLAAVVAYLDGDAEANVVLDRLIRGDIEPT